MKNIVFRGVNSTGLQHPVITEQIFYIFFIIFSYKMVNFPYAGVTELWGVDERGRAGSDV